MPETKLSAPWYIYASKLKKLFSYDPDISVGDVTYDESGYSVEVHCGDFTKSAALARLLPAEKVFGNTKLHINVFESGTDVIVKAFETLAMGNGAIRDVKVTEGTMLAPARVYVRMEPEVMQFYADDLQSYDGYESMLAEDVAKDVFGSDNAEISFCTVRIGEN